MTHVIVHCILVCINIYVYTNECVFFLRPVFIESKTTGPYSIKIIPIVSFRFFEGLLLRY